ncbi:MAG: low temperature requirement protein A [bacterium]
MTEGKRQQQVVPWFELFYDLIVVSVVVAAGKILIDAPTWDTAAFTAVSLLLLLTLWLLTTLSYGLYRRNSPPRRLLLLCQMAALLIAALAAGSKGLPSEWGYLAISAAFACAAGVYALHRRWSPADGIPNGLMVAMCLVGTAYFLAAGIAVFLLPDASLDSSIVIILVGLLLVALPAAGPYLRAALPSLDLHHLEERVGLVVIIVLGESFLALILRLASQSSIPGIPAFVLAITVPYAVWSLYFTGVISRDPPRGVKALRLWFGCHALLVVSIAASATALADMTLIPFSMLDDTESSWSPMSTLGIAVSLLLICLLSSAGDEPTVSTSAATIRVMAVATAVIAALQVINLLPQGPPRGPLFLSASLILVLAAVLAALLAPRSKGTVAAG